MSNSKVTEHLASPGDAVRACITYAGMWLMLSEQSIRFSANLSGKNRVPQGLIRTICTLLCVMKFRCISPPTRGYGCHFRKVVSDRGEQISCTKIRDDAVLKTAEDIIHFNFQQSLSVFYLMTY